ncbi:hypothetical protein VAR608DRAFT_6644 [Variovorax sp. HW608]|uniref:hypothetical protein n=1 Tax=Variovorax sp. HW608 TaxID=1034889 RepID=UPI00081F7ED6|nr:hypothetical protein [Variovorax sp. HW608]SCK60235.1 hypothetical protein VAR608DRAFT_6644 [Variovorax sp. HW608]
MRPLPVFTAAFTIVTSGLASCADAQNAQTTAGAREDLVVDIRLAGSRINAGKIAWAHLIGLGEQTAVSVTAAGVPPQVSRPVHLYTYIYEGACGALSERPAHSLNAIVLARSTGPAGRIGPPYTVENTARVRLATLRATPHALVIRSAPADGNLDLFCGDIAVSSASSPR